MRNKFYTKRGYLTNHALACGYLETNLNYNNNDFNKQVTMSLDGVYHVKAYDHNKHERITWECFDSLKDARKYFNKVCKQIGDKRRFNV